MTSHRPAALVLAVLLLALSASPARASEPATPGETVQDLMFPRVQEIALSIGVFFVLVFVLGKTAWKPILAGLKQREETIQKAVDDAQRASAEARAVMAEYEGKLSQAKEEAQAIADEARKDAEEVRRRIEEDAKVRAEETLQRALTEIERAKNKAYHEILDDVAEIATEAAARVLRRELRPEDNVGLVDEIVTTFTKSSRGRA
jgi:F-type H+-transporting ATPase subunit b